jgi:hypothetical protein
MPKLNEKHKLNRKVLYDALYRAENYGAECYLDQWDEEREEEARVKYHNAYKDLLKEIRNMEKLVK